MSKPTAEVGFSCGRSYLSVAGIVVAMEGDKCRDLLPEEACEPIPQDELESASIGDMRATELPRHIVRFFRGDTWTEKSLTWAADRINAVVVGRAQPYTQSEAMDPAIPGCAE